MSMIDRAAQFSPFAALTGYGEVIKETARLTDRKPELSESEKAELDYDDGRAEYELEFHSGHREYECTVDAVSGKVLSFERD